MYPVAVGRGAPDALPAPLRGAPLPSGPPRRVDGDPCKVVPSAADGDLVARLRRIDQQEKENRDRAALSAVEEAKALRVKMQVLRQLHPEATDMALQEMLAEERKVSHTTVFRLLTLLKAPPALQQAILERRITSRDVAFRLVTHWEALLKEHLGDANARREVQFRDTVRAWAQGQGLELNGEAVGKYAAEHHLDPARVRADVKKAAKIEAKASEHFARTVERAMREGWTVKDAHRILAAGKERKPGAAAPALFERSGKGGGERFTVFLGRLDDPAIAGAEARQELARMLRELLARVESSPAATPASP